MQSLPAWNDPRETIWKHNFMSERSGKHFLRGHQRSEPVRANVCVWWSRVRACSYMIAQIRNILSLICLEIIVYVRI